MDKANDLMNREAGFTFPQTKLFAPQIGDDILPRPFLLNHLQQAIPTYPFTLISAPAGAGKTTLLASWLASEPSFPVSWLRLDDEDNDPTLFLSLLLASLRQIAPEFGKVWQALLAETGNVERNMPRLIGVLINEILSAEIRPFALVLDDLHAIQNNAILKGLDHLLENMPQEMHMIATSRYDPPLSLARMRVQNRLAEIRLEALQFDDTEATALLNGRLQLNLSPKQLAQLNQHSAGWVAGLRLLALSFNHLASDSERHAFLQNLLQTERYLFDFFAEEIFNHQPAEIQQFLLQTAVLDEITPTSCQAVTAQQNAAQLLDELLRRNLFLNGSRDKEGRVAYRYHDLFADFLRQQQKRALDPSTIQQLHKRAAENASSADVAIRHHLAAQLWDEASDLITEIGLMELEQGFVRSQIQFWIAQLPEVIVEKRPFLTLILGVIAYRSGKMSEARFELEQCLPQLEGDVRRHWALFYLAGALLELDGAQAQLGIMYQIDLDQLPVPMQILAHLIFVWSYTAMYRWQEATDHLQQMFEMVQAQGDENAFRMVSPHLGINIYFTDLGTAPFKVFCQQAKRYFKNSRIIQMGATLQLGTIAALEGRIEEAMQHATVATEISQQLGGFGYVDQNIGFVHGLVAMASDNDQAIKNALEMGLRYADERGQFRAALVGLAYFNGRIAWLKKNPQRIKEMGLLIDSVDDQLQSLETEAIQALLAGYLADLDGRFAVAEQSIRRAVALQNTYKHPALTGSAGLVLAELYFKWKRPFEALALLQPELLKWKRLGTPGIVLMQGQVILPLLKLAQQENIEPEFIAHLLTLFPNHSANRSVTVPETAETLTPREVEVLYLLVEGASNAAIADKLVISQRTVKAHVSKILAKLNVSSRMEAAAKARTFL